MAARRLTELAVQKAKAPASGRVELWDGSIPGFGLRITSTGVKSWVLVYRMGGEPRRFTFGHWPTIGLADARREALEARRKIEAGLDPAKMKAESRKRDQRDTFEAVVAEFIDRYAKPKNRSWRETERLLKRELGPRWNRRPINTITRRDVIEALDAIVDRGAPVVANRTLAAVRKMFGWAIGRGIVDASPVAGIEPPADVKSRDRVLDDDELAAVWRACDGLGWPLGPMFHLLVLTAQRRTEVATMRWRDVDLDRRFWTLPREFTKADRTHTVPLSPQAATVLEALPRVGASGFVFPSRRLAGGTPVSGFSAAKARLDQLSGVEGWRLHDLRRTAASGMARLGVAPHVVEKILNHTTGTISGVAAVYNRHSYQDEMRRALEVWGRHIEALAAPADERKVVPLRAAP